ncbi:MAG: octanoyltransferase [Gemmatimonadaceae bacterium]|nr:octanoyltransferase [Gemmatimonadaceae bacterium]
MSGWRLLDTGAHDGAWNMACDVALMARARRTGETVLRVYAWEHPTLSFGRHEAARRQYDEQAIIAAGVGIVRRPTGGRALLHHREVTYSITAPLRDAESLTASVKRFNALLLRALHHLGVPATEADTPRSLRPEGAACFAVPSAGELTLHGRKLVGSAQVRQDGALLQHGSILLDDDQGMIAGFARGAYIAPAPAASLREVLGDRATYSAVRDALMHAATTERGAETPAALVFSPEAATDGDPAFRDALATFRDPGWTWRR